MNLLSKLIKNLASRGKVTDGRRTIYIPYSSGVRVTEDTALTYSAVWACVRIISQSIAALPWTVRARSVRDGRLHTEPLLLHPANRLVSDKPNEEMDSLTWRETMVAWALIWGNGYSEIERNRAGQPVALWPIEPDRVDPIRDVNDVLFYRIRNYGKEDSMIEARNMFHLKGLGWNGRVGYSVLTLAAKTFGLGLATEEYGTRFFENDTTLGVILKHPRTLGDKALEHLKESFAVKFGGVRRSHKPIILEEGMDVERLGMPARDAQLLESRKFQVSEVARWYGVPLHKLSEMDKSTFNNIEHQSIEFVQDALVPWARRLELEADSKLIVQPTKRRIYSKINLNGLLRGDMKARGEWYRTMSSLGVFSVNDILELEDRNPIGPDGDKRLVQMNLTTLEKVGESETESSSTTSPPDESSSGKDPEATAVIRQAVERTLTRESHRAVDALRRYDGDRSGLIEWMNKFYKQHKEYMKEQLVTPLKSLGITEPEYLVWRFLDEHIDRSRLEILVAFDEGSIGEPFNWDASVVMDELLRGDL